jgi:hypothetical protein
MIVAWHEVPGVTRKTAPSQRDGLNRSLLGLDATRVFNRLNLEAWKPSLPMPNA